MGRSPETTYKIMSAIKSKDTRPEIKLRKELWRRGLRYRKNVCSLPGCPDIVISKVKLAIFCDGDFWHGHNWAIRGYKTLEDELKRYSEKWANKIQKNISRDLQVTKELENFGWHVIRIWESDIKTNVTRCGAMVEYTYGRILKNIDEDDWGENDDWNEINEIL